MYVCICMWTLFLQLRTSLLNHVYQVCVLGPLNTLCCSFFIVSRLMPFSDPVLGCLSTVFTHSFNITWLLCATRGALSTYFLFFNILAAFGPADLTLSGTFLLASASDCQPSLVLLVPWTSPILPPSPLYFIQSSSLWRHPSLVLALCPHSPCRTFLHLPAYKMTTRAEDALL